MKGWQAILIAAATVIGLVIALTLALPKHFRVVRTVVIDAPTGAVWAQIGDLRAHEKWAPWLVDDSTTLVTWGPTTTGDGASYTWTSADAGGGVYTVTLSDAPRRLGYEVTFDSMGKATGWLETAPEGHGTKVTWTFEGLSEGPLGGVVATMMDRLVGDTFAGGLARLATLSEAEPPPVPVSSGDPAEVGVQGTDPGGALPPQP